MKRFTLLLVAALCCLTSRAGIDSVDDLVGVYSVKATGGEKISTYADMVDLSTKSYNVEISKNDDGTITINNLLGFHSNLIGTVDLEAKTITITPGIVMEYFTFAASSDSTAKTSVVAEFTDNGKISVFDFSAWYYKSDYIQPGSEIALTKTVITLDWSIEGSFILSDNSDDTNTVNYYSTRTTLSKYTGSANYDYILKVNYDGSNPAEIRFKVSGAEITSYDNGYYPDGYGAYFYYVYPDNYYMYLSTYTGYASFEGDKDGGELYIWANDYQKDSEGKSNKIHAGWLAFTWGTKDGISTPTIDTASDAAPIYNLVGCKVDEPTAGIYIQNGKKFIIK